MDCLPPKAWVKNPDALGDEYLPPILPQRSLQIATLRTCLEPLLRGQPARHAFLSGESGTGKTTVARFVLHELQRRAPLRAAWISGWEHGSCHSVLAGILKQLNYRLPLTGTGATIVGLRDALQGKPCVIVLDDLDRLPPKARNQILYLLSSVRQCGIVCIAQASESLYAASQAVLSRVVPKMISFPAYEQRDVMEILDRRAREALLPGAWSKAQLAAVARTACGDARVAIQLLRDGIRQAEANGQAKLNGTSLANGASWNGDWKIRLRLKTMGPDCALLYESIRTNPGILSPDLWNLYRQTCRRKKHKPAYRSYQRYLEKLIESGIVTAERAPLRGFVRMLRC